MQRGIAKSTLFLYSVPNVTHMLAFLPLLNYVPSFYSDEKALPLAVVGLTMVFSRALDIFIDPLVGTFSDRTRTPIGRRKPWIMAGLPIAMIALWFLFVPPETVSPIYLFLALFFVNLGTTVMDLPYAAWGAEMSDDYNERTRVAAWRGAFGAFGNLLALSIPVGLDMMGYADVAQKLFWIALFYVVTQPILFALPLLLIKEGPLPKQLPITMTMMQRMAVVKDNRAFLLLIGANVLLAGGASVITALNNIVMTHLAGVPELFSYTVLLQNIAILVTLPLWMHSAKRLGKHITVAIAGGLAIILSLINFAWGQSDGYYLAATIIAQGIPTGAIMFLGAAMIADLVDVDTAQTGEERTALYFAFMNLAVKFAIILGLGLGTMLPAAAGFQPSDAIHSPESLLALKAVYAFVCPILAIPAIWLILKYPITADVHADILRQIKEQRQAV
jgi:glycoside/pentoside/hexuronide:cation symporter, GPH family